MHRLQITCWEIPLNVVISLIVEWSSHHDFDYTSVPRQTPNRCGETLNAGRRNGRTPQLSPPPGFPFKHLVLCYITHVPQDSLISLQAQFCICGDYIKTKDLAVDRRLCCIWFLTRGHISSITPISSVLVSVSYTSLKWDLEFYQAVEILTRPEPYSSTTKFLPSTMLRPIFRIYWSTARGATFISYWFLNLVMILMILWYDFHF